MYYKHSGRFSLGGLMIGALIGCAGAAILGYIYGRGSILIEDEHLAFLATLALGAGIGGCAGYGLIWGKVRNHAVNFCLQGIASAVSLYVSWAAWIADIFKRFQVDDPPSWIEFLKHPVGLWRAMCYINQYGTWSLGKGEDPTTGAELWAIWFIEAALVVVGAMVIGYEVLRNHAFCDRCESWCRRAAKLILAVPQNPDLLKRQLEANDWRTFDSLPAENKAANHLAVGLDSCGECHQLNTVTVTLVARRKPRKIIEHLLIASAQAEKLKQLSMKAEQGAKLDPPKANAAAAGKH